MQKVKRIFKKIFDNALAKWLFCLAVILFVILCWLYADYIGDKYGRQGAAFILIGTLLGAVLGGCMWGIKNNYQYFSYKLFGYAALGTFIGLLTFMSGGL